jgi:hypothetical protein
VKSISQMSQLEIAAYVTGHLQHQGIDVVLSGGLVVTFYSRNLYVSKGVDLINVAFTRRSKIRKAMQGIGFEEQGRHFIHPETTHIIEFPNGPLSVGQEPVKNVQEVSFETGILRVISATDCVKDRLCAFYFWNDLQGLEQALLVCNNNPVDLEEIKGWSQREGKTGPLAAFLIRLEQ